MASPKHILHTYQLAEARGHIKPGLAVAATYATIMESGVQSFAKGFYGLPEYNKAISECAATKQAEDTASHIQEALIHDVAPMSRRLKEAMTTTDFPGILANLRSKIVRQSFNPTESMFWQIATIRETGDFKPLRGLRVDAFDRLHKRPEGVDVDMVKFGTTDDAYSVCNYELGFDYTWEMWKNDDLGVFNIALNNLGIAARRTRGLVTFEAIRDGVAATMLAGTAGGPDIDHTEALVLALANQLNSDGKPRPRSLSDIVIPTNWRTKLATTLNSENVLGPVAARNATANPVYKTATPHEEPMMGEVLNLDWLGYDARQAWLEIAILDDFRGGPLTYVRMPDVTDHVEQGSFANHSLGVKVGDGFAVKVTDPKSVIRVQGS